MAISIVLSDLHLGSGPVDDFEPEIEQHLIAALKEWQDLSDKTELIINGDFLDFVQAPPYKGRDLRATTIDGIPLCFTEPQSIKKFEVICNDHAGVFDALRAFLAHRSANSIVILPGNHDADLFWPGVRERFRDLVCGGSNIVRDRLTFWLNSVYRPAICPELWIEHGHQHDFVNSFFISGNASWSEENPPIRADRSGTPRLYECIGTRFMIMFLNDLDREYPYVDNIKPFWRFLELFGASALRPGFGPLRAAVAVAAMNAFLAKTIATRPKDVWTHDHGQPESPVPLILSAYESASDLQRRSFVENIQRRGFPLGSNPRIILSNEDRASPFLDFLTENIDLLEVIEREPNTGTLNLGASFVPRKVDELRIRASEIIHNAENAVQGVIMGHTHEVVDEPRYINTGSWTRYYQAEPGERLRPWTMLKRQAWKSFPFDLRYVVLESNRRPVLKRYR